MAFFDKVNAAVSKAGESLSGAASKAQQSVKTMQAVSGLNSQIKTQQETIRTTYLTIGQSYVENHKNDENAEFAQQVAAIAAAEAAIVELQAQINALKGNVPCPNCGTQIGADEAFCPNCGTKKPQPEPETPAAASVAFCPSCGAQVEAGAAFCPSCGTKLNG